MSSRLTSNVDDEYFKLLNTYREMAIKERPELGNYKISKCEWAKRAFRYANGEINE